jgi:hypothetical protein
MRAVLHAFAVTRGSTSRARQGRRRAEIVNSPILREAGPGQRSLEGSRAELMPGTRDEQSRCQHARIVLDQRSSGRGAAAAIPVAKRGVMILRSEMLAKPQPAAPDRSMRRFVSLVVLDTKAV